MENFTQLDIALICKEVTRKPAKDIAFLIDRPVGDVAEFLKDYCFEKGIISYQQLLDEKKKVREPRAPKPKAPKKKKPVIISRRIDPDAINKPGEGRLKATTTRAVFKSLATDYSQLHLVRIDDKTQVYSKPGETPEQTRQRYLNNKVAGQHISSADRQRATTKRKA